VGGSPSARPASGAFLSAPAVDAVRPAAGPLVGGTKVTIRGHNLDSVDRVLFGGVPVSTFTIISPSEIWTVAPATTTARRVAVTVHSTDGDADCADCVARFAYLGVPRITGLTPPIGPLSGGTSVTIHGRGFAPGVKVFFGPLRLTQVQRVNSSTLRIVVPAKDLLKLSRSLLELDRIPVDVRVKTRGGVSQIDPLSRFTYL
jgi:hypothetical protein